MDDWKKLQDNGSFPGVRVSFPEKDFLLLSFPELYPAVSSALYGQGMVEVGCVFNFTVPKSYTSDSPANDIIAAREKKHIPENSIGMMTAAEVSRVACAGSSDEAVAAASFVTLGLSNPASAGRDTAVIYNAYKPGTINTIILFEGEMTPAAMVNAIVTATEAKVRALYDCRLRFADGSLLTGTTTDTIAIVASGKGKLVEYAGTGTEAGFHIGRSVYSATLAAATGYLACKKIKRPSGELLLWQ